MEWSAEFPTVGGLYWMNQHGVVVMVNVSVHPATKEVLIWVPGSNEGIPKEEVEDYDWMGPIAIPLPPPEYADVVKGMQWWYYPTIV